MDPSSQESGQYSSQFTMCKLSSSGSLSTTLRSQQLLYYSTLTLDTNMKIIQPGHCGLAVLKHSTWLFSLRESRLMSSARSQALNRIQCASPSFKCAMRVMGPRTDHFWAAAVDMHACAGTLSAIASITNRLHLNDLISFLIKQIH